MRLPWLVDEYNAPINSCILNNELIGQLTEVMKQFFAVIKAQDEHIHYSLITGITKFSHVSLFSGANQFRDLSYRPVATQLLGFTESQIRQFFAPHLNAIASRRRLTVNEVIGEIRTWYNGYRFSLESDQMVYNPFAVVEYLDGGVAEDYWFRSGTPTLVFQLLTQEPSRLVEFWGAHAEKKLFLTDSELKGKIDMTQVADHVTALLFQTGYLTIRGSVDDRVRLDFPNKEVSTSFVNGLLKHRRTGGARQDPGRFVREATAGLRTGDPTKFFDHLQALIAGIPYQLHGGKEGYYHSLVHMASFFLPECRYQSECSMATGRIDLVIELGKRVFVMEFKKDSSAQVALDQIDENKYYQKYHHRFDEIVLIGANFCTQKKRNLDGWTKRVVRPSGPRAGAASSTTTTTTTASS